MELPAGEDTSFPTDDTTAKSNIPSSRPRKRHLGGETLQRDFPEGIKRGRYGRSYPTSQRKEKRRDDSGLN